MARSGLQGDEPEEPTGRFADDLIGLDPRDPEVQAFAEHLDRVEQPQSRATVEGMLQGVEDFAQSANRAGGHRRLAVVIVVFLILVGVGITLWNTIVPILGTLAG
ncbi:hypothetical protein [Haloactinomyces albus]|uniref:Uncharacterized protein n=1 Tax=Haloactinomyces albus TaxID=1352928 RepID=A0AAE3ZH98_9ACTN|nr:hypothetical protein [Haloactinomyces albus]MDR7303187.1 hypothetical protein [Haloactinomyces albus]